MVQEHNSTTTKGSFEGALAQVGAEIDRLVKHAQAGIEERRPELDAKREEIEAQLLRLKEQGSQQWKEIQPDLERVLDDLQAVLKKLADKIG